jgi:hypothetical protein
MNGITTNPGGAEADAALTQIAKVKDTAEHLAKDDTPAGADQFRVIAGLVHQLAEHVERLVATSMQPPIPGQDGYPEDRHASEAPVAPLSDRPA